MSINFHIPDFVRHSKLNYLLIDTLQKYPHYFRDNIKIASVYGAFPTAAWNGGRTISGNMDRRYMEQITSLFNNAGVPIRFTFSNPMIKIEHLEDEFCNYCLKMADNGMNEVIVVSQMLEDYIRRKYPSYKITSSTCKQLEDIDGLKEELEKDYNLVVLDYNWNNRFEELEKIPHKDKCELLINACCVPNCPRRKEHYQTIGRQQLELSEHMKNNPNAPFELSEFKCEQMQLQFYQTTKYSTHITPDDLYNKYVPMGYKNFKIEGRPLADISVLESYVYYMAKPEYRDELRLSMLLALTGKIKHFNM